MASQKPGWLDVLRFRLSPPGRGEILARRPPQPGEIEEELRAPPPRLQSFPEERVSHLLPSRRALLREGIARRAWVVRLMRWSDGEGPEIRAWIAFETERGLVRGYRSYSFDAYHAYMGAPAYMEWFDTHMVEGGVFTILHPPGAPGAFQVYRDLRESTNSPSPGPQPHR